MTDALILFTDAAHDICVLQPDIGDPQTVVSFLDRAFARRRWFQHGTFSRKPSITARDIGLDYLLIARNDGYVLPGIEPDTGPIPLGEAHARWLRTYATPFEGYEYLIEVQQRPKQQTIVTLHERYEDRSGAVRCEGSYIAFRTWAKEQQQQQ